MPKHKTPGKFERGRLSAGAPRTSIEELMKTRQKRWLVTSAAAGAFGAATIGMAFNPNEMPHSLKVELASLPLFAMPTIAGIAVGLEGYRPKIMKAMLHVGRALSVESAKNHELRKFLEKHRYVVVDRAGRLVGTNRKQIFGIGRMRLETKKILASKPVLEYED